MFSRARQRIFRDLDTPFELWLRGKELPAPIRKLLARSLRAIDDRLRPDMGPILLARKFYMRSMLHTDTLLELYRRASQTDGAIVEIGTYTGGGTIMMATARARSGCDSPQIAIDVGGTSENPHMPSDDIIRDLKANLAEFGVADRVAIIQGWSKHVVDQVEQLLGGHKIGLLVIDADGEVRRDIELYGRLLAPRATVVFDDYITNEPCSKAEHCFRQVNQMAAEGMIRKSRVVKWGTWFGTYIGPSNGRAD
jgi:predicted O-methyltransferase YrrM